MAAQEPIEGTILTEGLGVGRGTRIEDAKGTVRLDTGGKESGIRGGQGGLDQSAVITIDGREAQVRARAINPLEVKPLITDGEGVSSHAILRAGEILSKSAFDYANRVSDLKADAAVVAFNQKARQWFYGSDDGSTPGFNALKGQSAVDARQKEFARVDNDMSDIIASVDPEVRQKAAARLQGIRDQALNRASSHIVQAQQEAEVEMKFIKLQDSERDRVNDFTRPDIDQATFLSHFGSDYKEGKIQWDVSTVKVAESIYLKERKTGGSGLEKLRAFIDINSPTVGVEARNRLADLVKQKTQEEQSLASHQLTLAKAQKKEEDEKRLTKFMLDVEKDPSVLANAASATFIADQYGISDPQDIKFAIAYGESKVSGKSAVRDNSQEFFTNVVTPMHESGTNIPYTEYVASAMKHGVPLSQAKQWYDEGRQVLKADEKMLRENTNRVVKDLNAVFHVSSQANSPMAFVAMLKGDQETLDKLALSTGSNDPPELIDLKNRLFSIMQDQSKTPYERSMEQDKLIQSKISEAQASDPLKKYPGMSVLSANYTIKRAQKKALEIAKGEDTVIQAKKKANEITPLMQAAASITGEIPSKRAVDTIAAKVYSNSLVEPNSLFLDVINGESTLAVKMKDGSVKHINKKAK